MTEFTKLDRVRLPRQWQDDVNGTVLQVREHDLVLQFDDEPYVRRTMDHAEASKRLIKIDANGQEIKPTQQRNFCGDK